MSTNPFIGISIIQADRCLDDFLGEAKCSAKEFRQLAYDLLRLISEGLTESGLGSDSISRIKVSHVCGSKWSMNKVFLVELQRFQVTQIGMKTCTACASSLPGGLVIQPSL